jgi:hypothetical protein
MNVPTGQPERLLAGRDPDSEVSHPPVARAQRRDLRQRQVVHAVQAGRVHAIAEAPVRVAVGVARYGNMNATINVPLTCSKRLILSQIAASISACVFNKHLERAAIRDSRDRETMRATP